MIKIFLVDDHQIIRDGIKQFLDDESDIQVLGEANSANMALRKMASKTPDILITDLSMPNKNGFELIKEALSIYPDLKVIILTMHAEEAYINEAIKLGVKAYLSKDASRHELLEAIHQVIDGETFFNSKVTNVLMNSMVRKAKGEDSGKKKIAELLTTRESEIVQLIVDGFSSPQIAEKLFISSRTVENHRSNIMAKLEVKNTIELVRLVLEEKYNPVGNL